MIDDELFADLLPEKKGYNIETKPEAKTDQTGIKKKKTSKMIPGDKSLIRHKIRSEIFPSIFLFIYITTNNTTHMDFSIIFI